ncbi:MAG: efflux RND transporter periplasmic adaptor subunit [Bacteroidales bacterium]|nr:efflux RND transporter periplasmic adaptor subunit [Bacteroidales bacterium]
MQINQTLIAIICSALIASNCSKREITAASSDAGTDTIMSVITLTKKQIRNFDLETARPEKQLVERNIQCTGMVEVPISNCARVTAPYGGTVNSLFIKNKTYVRSGSLLAEITNPDYLRIQQEYLEKKSLLYFYHEEFTRQGELTVEHASSIRKMQQAEVNYRMTEVSLFALKEKLKILGIHADSLTVNNISASIKILAPISGYVAEKGVISGSQISPSTAICDIVNPEDLFLSLQLPEQYAAFIKTGQSVNFTFPGDTLIQHTGRVKLTAPQIDPEKKTLNLIVSVQNPELLPLPGTSIHATIHTIPDSAFMITAKAIFSTKSSDYIFMYNNGVVTRIPVVTGIVYDGMIELKNLNTKLYYAEYVVNRTNLLNSLFKDE